MNVKFNTIGGFSSASLANFIAFSSFLALLFPECRSVECQLRTPRSLGAKIVIDVFPGIPNLFAFWRTKATIMRFACFTAYFASWKWLSSRIDGAFPRTILGFIHPIVRLKQFAALRTSMRWWFDFCSPITQTRTKLCFTPIFTRSRNFFSKRFPAPGACFGWCFHNTIIPCMRVVVMGNT